MALVGTSDPESREDSELVMSARAGEVEAREALGRKVSRDAYVFALQLTSDPDASQDIAQDAVLRFFRSLDSFDERRRIEPWLYQIVRNLVRDRGRRQVVRRYESLDEQLDSGRPPAVAIDEAADPAVQADRARLRERIWRCVDQLSDDHREIFVLRDHHQLSYREIAEVLSIPEGTVMSRLHAARMKLRALLAADAGGLDR
ncbi:MAG: sigma-70 family RNA polymerase sigma factor [Actinomycetota bacterium]